MRRLVPILALLAVLLLAGAYLLSRPAGPDFTDADRGEIVAFVGTGDFDALPAGERQRILNEYLDTTEALGFRELMAMAFGDDPSKQTMIDKIRALPRDEREQVWDRVGQIGLDAYWREPPARREMYLVGFAVAQQVVIEQDPERFPLPTADEFRTDMSRMMTRQDPKTQVLAGQFMLDLQRTRKQLGLRDPF